jgi:hypothetical protein
MKDKLPDITPMYQIRPQLWFIGKILGMSLYIEIDTRVPNHQEKFHLATKLLMKAFGMTEKDVKDENKIH